MRSPALRIAIAVLAVGLAACAADTAAHDGIDASALGPRDAGGIDGGCALAMASGSPDACFARWSCGGLGALTLACESDTDGGTACVCFRDDLEPTVTAEHPTSCTDPSELTAFVRRACGWSWL
jgi:hypothetical protein